MNSHPFLRAYLAGVFVTTLVLPLILAVFIVVRLVLQVPVPIERAIIFPMALVPLGWGLWNMLWLASHERTHLALGVHGAIFPFVLVPSGALVARCLEWPRSDQPASFGSTPVRCPTPSSRLASASALPSTTWFGNTSSAFSTALSASRDSPGADNAQLPRPSTDSSRKGGDKGGGSPPNPRFYRFLVTESDKLPA